MFKALSTYFFAVNCFGFIFPLLKSLQHRLMITTIIAINYNYVFYCPIWLDVKLYLYNSVFLLVLKTLLWRLRRDSLFRPDGLAWLSGGHLGEWHDNK